MGSEDEPEWLTPKGLAAETGVSSGDVDLSECVREPIHLLGGIQSYGTLVAARRADGVVDTVGTNTGRVLGAEAAALAGRPVTELIGEEQWALACESVREGGGTVPFTVEASGTARLFDVTAHEDGGLVLLEFEPRPVDAPFVFRDFYPRVRRALQRLQGASDVVECCAAAVREIRALTGYDRVVAYRFDGPDGPGQVIAEERAEGREPWLGLWFPASDIPPQARRLYARNWIRVIADVDDPTAGLSPERRPATGTPLDLSGSVLRTVSGYHLEYLRNIDVSASMSVSLLHGGELWGLIACHSDAPKRLAPELRAACEFFGVTLSLQLAAISDRERTHELAGGRARLASLLARLPLDASEDVTEAFAGSGTALPDLLGADGALLRHGGRTWTAGPPVPSGLPEVLARVAGRLPAGEAWSTDRLPEALGPDTAEAGRLPAGLLVLPLHRDGDLLAWWRGEQPMPRDWAADPARPVRIGPRGLRLTPRGSSAVYRATVRGRSLPWSTAQRTVAAELWREIGGLLNRRAAVLQARNAELARINEDLDSFAHAAAHDLKEPLRGISNAAAFTLEDAGGTLDETSLRRLETVRRLSERMDDLLDSLLRFSRLGRVGLVRERVALDGVLDDALLVAGPRLAERSVSVVRPPSLPQVVADPGRLREVLENLLVNAAKYAADAGPRRVTVEVRHLVPPGGAEPVAAVVVEDNGIGIPQDRHEDVLQLFRRLHPRTERGGGSGVGLAVVRRIVERHGGRLWLRSPVAAPDGADGGGPGTAVCFTLGTDGD